MFSIIISEKGGAERKESFEKNEINVGRVQGNDLMLPKGNVSKHHARLLYRDGRFIVTDLKSTNGTYVNGRKIAQATIVREGDKIYIGDFVLRLDSGSGANEAPQAADDESVRTLARNSANASGGQAAQPQINTAPPNAASGAPAAHASGPSAAGGGAGGSGGQPRAMSNAPSPAASSGNYDGQSDEEPPPERPLPKPVAARGAAGAGVPGVDIAAPPQNARGQTLQLQGNARTPIAPPAQSPQRAPAQALREPAPAPAAASNAGNSQSLAPIVAPPPARVAPRETAAQAARRLALITLVDRVADTIDLGALKTSPTVEEALSHQIERTAREQASTMREEGEAPEGTDLDQLVRDALRELVGLGPIGPLLEDDEVSEIHVLRNDQVIATRGQSVVLADASFTSEDALSRVIGRLAEQAGEAWRPGESVIERRLARGAHMLAIAPPSSSGHVLVIRKRRRVDATLEDLVRSGAMSRPMAVFLDACVQARANVLASGPSSAATSLLLAALASAAPAGERIALVHDAEEIAIQQAHVVSMSLSDPRTRSEETLRAAARLRPDRIVIGGLSSGVAAATLDAITEGSEGVIAATSAPTLRQALARIVSQLMMARPGLSAESAREVVGESFDIAIELATMPDGRHRITRIAELGGSDAKGIVTRDLFTFTPDPSGEGTFVATGVIPRVVAEFAARGVKVDQNVFKRSVGR